MSRETTVKMSLLVGAAHERLSAMHRVVDASVDEHANRP